MSEKIRIDKIERKGGIGKMKNSLLTMRNTLYWTPRILGIIYICFIAIFALDVFIPGKTIGYYLVAFSIHLVPNFAIAVLLFIAWKHERLGGVFFILAALFFTVFFETYRMVINFLLISFPLILIGILFFLHGKMEVKK